jgi:hypothetical protein
VPNEPSRSDLPQHVELKGDDAVQPGVVEPALPGEDHVHSQVEQNQPLQVFRKEPVDESSTSPDRVRKPSVNKGQMMWEGLPYVGQVMDFKESDPPHKLPQLAQAVHTRVFKADSQEELDTYSQILERALVGHAKILSEIKREVGPDSWNILMTWADLFYKPPEVER